MEELNNDFNALRIESKGGKAIKTHSLRGVYRLGQEVANGVKFWGNEKIKHGRLYADFICPYCGDKFNAGIDNIKSGNTLRCKKCVRDKITETKKRMKDPDHMNLNNILSRWTIVDVLTIPTGNSVGPTTCFSLPVTPMACFVTTASSTTVFTPTALSMAALPFNRWRGTITYRFQAVGTAFMKGKIKISHDVRSPSNVSEVQKFDTQVLNSVIWDLATTNIIEIKVPWASNQVFKTCGLLRRATHLVDPNGNVPADVDANGSLLLNQFTVLNDNGETGIGIIVSIKGEEGMVFGDMRAVLANYTFAGIDRTFTGDAPQSGEYSNIPLDTIDFGQSNEYTLRFYDGTYLLITPIIWNKLITRYYNDHKDDQAPHSMVYSNELNNNILTGDKPGALLAININGLEENLTDHDTLAMLS